MPTRTHPGDSGHLLQSVSPGMHEGARNITTVEQLGGQDIVATDSEPMVDLDCWHFSPGTKEIPSEQTRLESLVHTPPKRRTGFSFITLSFPPMALKIITWRCRLMKESS